MRKKWLPKSLSYMMIFLMVVAVISLVTLPWLVSGYLDYAFAVTGTILIRNYFLAVLYVSGILALVVLYELRRIFNSVVNNTPFIMRNVTSLKRIGSCALFIGLVFVTKAFFFLTFLTLVVIFVFFLAALFCFVLGDVFEEAVNYKLENDLTI